MRWVPYGPNAVMIYFAERPDEQAFTTGCALLRRLQESPPEGLLEFTPGFTSLLLEFDSKRGANLPALADHVVHDLSQISPVEPQPTPLVEIPVIYDGPDLERVAAHNKLSIEEVITLHLEPIYKVYLLGFSPGFPYLGGLNPRLHTPRLAVPRTKVPGGSVAIGGEHTGIYPVETPGGWNIIGRTSTTLFSPSSDPQFSAEEMFRLQAGHRVRFILGKNG